MNVYACVKLFVEDPEIMDKFELDLSIVQNTIDKDPGRIAVRGNEHRMVRVAFDLFRLKGDESDDLWQVQADDDGQEFLVRTYSLPEDEKMLTASDWSVLEDTKFANLTVLYKGVPIQRIDAESMGAKSDAEVAMLKGAFLRRLASDVQFEFSFFHSLSSIKQDILKQAGFNPGLLLAGTDPRLLALEVSLRAKEAGGPLLINEGMHKMKETEGYEEKVEKDRTREPSDKELESLFGAYLARKDKEESGEDGGTP
jgi:hypothetical protein